MWWKHIFWASIKNLNEKTGQQTNSWGLPWCLFRRTSAHHLAQPALDLFNQLQQHNKSVSQIAPRTENPCFCPIVKLGRNKMGLEMGCFPFGKLGFSPDFFLMSNHLMILRFSKDQSSAGSRTCLLLPYSSQNQNDVYPASTFWTTSYCYSSSWMCVHMAACSLLCEAKKGPGSEQNPKDTQGGISFVLLLLWKMMMMMMTILTRMTTTDLGQTLVEAFKMHCLMLAAILQSCSYDISFFTEWE